MKLKDLISAVGATADNKELDREIELFPTDTTAKCTRDSLLFIYKRVGGGYSTEPKDIPPYITEVVCDFDYAVPNGVTAIRVDNVRSAYAYAHYLHSGIYKSDMKLIAVTGTNGKTTTATIIHEILNFAGIKCGYIGTGKIKIGKESISQTDYSMTTPDPELLYPTLRQMSDSGCEAAVMEVSSHSIALGKVAPLQFEYGIFTNLSHEHMDFHSNIEDYYATKLSLFEQCRMGIFNVDDEYGERAAEALADSAVTVGIINRADNYCTDIFFDGARGSEFLYHGEKAITKVSMSLPGAFNIYNAALAICCATKLGISPKCAKDAIGAIDSVEGRMEQIYETPTVIIDYAHTPYAMENALKTLRAHKRGGRLITVFGCGGNRDKEKRPLMGRIAHRYADLTIITEDNSRDEEPAFIFSDILSGMTDRSRVQVVPRRDDAIVCALESADPADTVAIIGKGHERYIIDKDGYRAFDERQIVKDFYLQGAEADGEN